MNAHAPTIEAEAEVDDAAGNALIISEPATALAVLTDPERFNEFYAKVKAFTDGVAPDVSTKKARDEIRSAAAKVAKAKTAIDKAGLGLTEEWRANTDKVNASRRVIKERLETLQVAVRKPLTDWETAEEERVERVKGVMTRLQAAAVVSIEDTVETVQARLDTIAGVEISAEVFQEYEAAALSHQENTLATLTAAVARLAREAEERAELERLRQADADRRAKEEADRIAAEAKAKEEADARAAAEAEAERQRLAEEAEARRIKDEADRVERERVAREEATAKAAADAQAETARKAAEELAEQKRKHDAEVARLQQEADERIAKAAAEERAREAEAKRIADEAAAEQAAAEKRARDREHRGLVMGAAKAAMMEIGGIGEDRAKKIVMAIVAGEIPHTAITF
jgi:hypothetical protein